MLTVEMIQRAKDKLEANNIPKPGSFDEANKLLLSMSLEERFMLSSLIFNGVL